MLNSVVYLLLYRVYISKTDVALRLNNFEIKN